jgi:predicted nuclease of restriction endonuclease-like (RecB) superfamily
MATGTLPSDYQAFLQSIKARVQQAQLRAVVAVNKELILLYWQIGKEILQRQQREGWGAKVIDRLSADLHAAFPQMKGFLPAISNICVRLRRRILKNHLCSRLLHKFPGSTTVFYSTK